jgi:hypothetical protein
MFIASNPGAPATAVGLLASTVCNTSSKFEAGSVLTNKTRLPSSENLSAVAHARQVFPTPPFPVKNKNRVASADSGL